MSAANGTNNEGHGHVYKRSDGNRMRCGGPRMCSDCAIDMARQTQEQQPGMPVFEKLLAGRLDSRDGKIALLTERVRELEAAAARTLGQMQEDVQQLAEARATIARLTEELRRTGDEVRKLEATIARQAGEIERLKAGDRPCIDAIVQQNGFVLVRATHLTDVGMRLHYVESIPALRPVAAGEETTQWRPVDGILPDADIDILVEQRAKDGEVWTSATMWRYAHPPQASGEE